MASGWQHTSVIKKFRPDQAGARKLAQRYGRTLVCVRHRHNPEGTVRYTTVELVVDQVRITHRKPLGQLVAVRLTRGEAELRRLVIASSGQWDQAIDGWWITRAVARRLRLLKRVVAVDGV